MCGVSDVAGWAFYGAFGLAGLAAIAWTTILAHRYGQERLQLGDTALSFWVLAAFLGLFLGLWLPVGGFLGVRALIRAASRARA
jgi:hypothetical protein